MTRPSARTIAWVGQTACDRSAGSIVSASANPPNKIPEYNTSPANVFQKKGTPATKQFSKPSSVLG